MVQLRKREDPGEGVGKDTRMMAGEIQEKVYVRVQVRVLVRVQVMIKMA